jgi:hypothetical protein
MANKLKSASRGSLHWDRLKAQSSAVSVADLRRKQKNAEEHFTLEGTPLRHGHRSKFYLAPDPNNLDQLLEISKVHVVAAQTLPDLDLPLAKIPRVSVTIRSDSSCLGQVSKDFAFRDEVNPLPSTTDVDPGQCVLWRQGPVRNRIILSLAQWGQVPWQTLRPTMTLGQLAKGTPWGPGQQTELVDVTNGHGVFAPFPSVMHYPPLLGSNTPLSDWEKVVWTMQVPQTPCWGT